MPSGGEAPHGLPSLNHSGCDQNQAVAVLQEALVVPALDLLAVGGRGLVPPHPGILVGVVQHLLEVPVDLPALVEVDLATAGFDQAMASGLLLRPKLKAP